MLKLGLLKGLKWLGALGFVWGIAMLMAAPTFAQDLQRLKQLIEFLPAQKNDIEVDQPRGDEIEKCTLESNRDPAGYIVKDSSGRMIRRFLDTSGNKKLDFLAYYRNGIEVYREIDTSGDGKPNEYRWLGTSGSRWGIDVDGDQKIDQWKSISAEEVAQELFRAIQTRDEKRFQALLLTPAEMDQLKFGDLIGSEIKKRWSKAQQDFAQFARSQREIDSTAQFIQTSNGFPAMVSADSYGNQTDILFYDHASVIFQKKDGQYGNLSVGSIVYSGDGRWRLVELPELAVAGSPITNGGAFFPMGGLANAGLAGGNEIVDSEMAKIYEQLDKIDEEIKSKSGAATLAALEKRKAGLLEQLIKQSEVGQNRLNSLMYATDSIVAAYQDDRFPDGLDYLDRFKKEFTSGTKDGGDYIQWRQLTSRYNVASMRGGSANREKAHSQWIKDLADFQQDFPDSQFTPESLIYLAVNLDNEEKNDEAIAWYKKIIQRFPQTPFGLRAKGALVRLEGQGKTFEFKGKDISGQPFNLQDRRLRDKIVVLHFWETWCAEELDQIQRLSEKYKNDVVFVSCNIELESGPFEEFMKRNPQYKSWIHLHEPGSIEGSSLAFQVGVPSEPMALLVDKEGKLAEPMVIFADLERQIERLRRGE